MTDLMVHIDSDHKDTLTENTSGQMRQLHSKCTFRWFVGRQSL